MPGHFAAQFYALTVKKWHNSVRTRLMIDQRAVLMRGTSTVTSSSWARA